MRACTVHPMPAGPKPATARCLGVALSGPRVYDGRLRDYPFVNPGGAKDIGADEIDGACRILWRSWAGALAVIALVALLLH